MATKIADLDFALQVARFRDACDFAGVRERNLFLNDLRTALNRLPYFNINKAGITYGNDPMVEIWGKYSVTRRHIDMVKLDLINVIEQDVADDRSWYYSLVGRDEGFQFRFLCRLDNNCFVTALVHVHPVR